MIGIWRRMGRRTTFIVGILIGMVMIIPLWLTPIQHSVGYRTLIVDSEIYYNDIYQYYTGEKANWTEGDIVVLISLNTTAPYRNMGLSLDGTDIVFHMICFYDNVGTGVGIVVDPELDTLYTIEDVEIRGAVLFMNVEDPVFELKIWVW